MKSNNGNNDSGLDFPYPSVKIGAIVTACHVFLLKGPGLAGIFLFAATFFMSIILFFPFFLWSKKYYFKGQPLFKKLQWCFTLTINSMATTSSAFVVGLYPIVLQ